MLNIFQQYGKDSESLAVEYLKKLGYKILEQNYRTQFGEIDIVAKDKDTLVFVEVKARRNERFGQPKSAVNWKKKQKISRTALYYLKITRQTQVKARFDVVSIRLENGQQHIDIIKNAFELAYG